MAGKSLDKALDIVSVLITGGEIRRNGVNAGLYEEYSSGSEVYDTVMAIFKKLNINIYEYNYALYITAGDNNKIFGYTNEELKREIGVRLNRELYLCYFIIYNIMTLFYKTGSSSTFAEFIKAEEIISSVDTRLANVIGDLSVMSVDEIEANSFREIGLVWEDMPMVITEESTLRAGRGSKAGFVKLVLNFLVNQSLIMEAEGRYYPKDKFRALIENYYNQYKGRLYEILRGGNENAAD